MTTRPTTGKLKKWLKRILLAMVMLGVGGWVAGVLLLRHWTAKPPPLPEDTAILRLRPVSHDGKTWLGKSWMTRRDGLFVVYLTGSEFEMGYADGVLQQEQMHTLENEFLKMVQGYVPRHWVMESLKNYIIYRNRHLSDFVPPAYLQQIHGVTMGCPDIHPEEGSFYNRMLNYHAAHDISYMLIDNPLVSRAGCTAFGAWGGATADSHLITGRNFDWEAADVFGRDRVVMLCEPTDGIPFVSLSWAGMVGVVSGMNRAGVSITMNGAPSRLPRETATPVAIAARDVLQHAHNLAEAVKIMSDAKAFVSTLCLIGSRADGKFVVVEKTPDLTQVREPEGDYIVCGNHFQTPELSQSDRNKEYVQEATSVARQARLTELVTNAHGKITPALAAEFLRDRKLSGGVFAGNDHRATLNAFIATHSTVMDLTSGIFWAAAPPHQLGKFVPFDVQDFSRDVSDRTIPEDATMPSGEYERAEQAQARLKEGWRSLKQKDPRKAVEMAGEAEKLNPGFYQNAALRGRALLALARNDEAAKAFRSALAKRPAFLEEKKELEAMLRQISPIQKANDP